MDTIDALRFGSRKAILLCLLAAVAGCALGIAIIAIVRPGRGSARPSGVITAGAFIVPDGNSGRARCWFGMVGDSMPGFLLSGSMGARLSLALMANGKPELMAFRSMTSSGLIIGLSDEGAPVVEFHDAYGGSRLKLLVAADGASVVGLSDENGRPRLMLGLDNQDEPTFISIDRAGSMTRLLR